MKQEYQFSRAKWYEAPCRAVHPNNKTWASEQLQWCRAQFGPYSSSPDAWSRWYPTGNCFRFRDEKDYVLFTLRWT